MKCIMQLDKSQVKKHVKVVGPATGNFRRDLYLMAGYKTIDFQIVGGGGGRSGRSTGNVNNVCYEYGGGGGGTYRVMGMALADMQPVCPYTVGAAGTAGTDSGNNVRGGLGGSGGDTSFAPLSTEVSVAYGGVGGYGGKIDYGAGSGTSIAWGHGGAGGGNSHALGVAGVGGTSSDLATPGDTDIVGNASGGGGGGGGQARAKINGSTVGGANIKPVSRGASGCWDLDDLWCTGGDHDGNQGGYGGGANIKTLIEIPVDTFYGSEDNGAPLGGFDRNGVLVIRAS